MRHYMTGCGERRVGFKNQVHECIRWLGLGTGVRVVGVGTVRSDISMRIELECQWVANIEKLCAMVWAAVVGGVPKRAARRYCVLPRGENDA